MKFTYGEFSVIRQMQDLGVQPNDYLFTLHHAVGNLIAENNHDGVKMLECLIEKLESKNV